MSQGSFSAAVQVIKDNRIIGLPSLVKAESVTDKLKLTLERNTQFSEEISIKGHMFAKNPYSGLYMEPEQARKFSAE